MINKTLETWYIELLLFRQKNDKVIGEKEFYSNRMFVPLLNHHQPMTLSLKLQTKKIDYKIKSEKISSSALIPLPLFFPP